MLGETKLSKLSVMCIYKREERVTTLKKVIRFFYEERSVPRRENPGYAYMIGLSVKRLTVIQ